MRITIFTSNQPRHLALINKLSSISAEIYVVQECTTTFPGLVQDFYNKSEVMQMYFKNVLAAENKIFGDLSFSKSNVKTLSIKSGDLNLLNIQQLNDALHSDVYIVFGSSFIKGWLIDYLISNKAINIHMGLSPYYRGNSCNFWALYDNHPECVGATIHHLSKGLDSGDILYHALPKIGHCNPFEFTMKAVEAAQSSLIERINNKIIFDMKPQKQNKLLEIRYTRNSDFTNSIAAEYLSRNQTNDDLQKYLNAMAEPTLVSPYYLD